MLCEQARVAAQPFALLAIWLSLSVACISAERVTAGVDYGFGPLWIDYDSVGDTLSRCDHVSMKLGGGFGPYYLTSVNAANKSTPISLKSNTSASWKIELSEDSHVAFNLTDRAGATVQTSFLTVKDNAEGKTCGNDTAYKAAPTNTPAGSASRSFQMGIGLWLGLPVALAVSGLMPFSVAS